jgi:hypothetical protein
MSKKLGRPKKKAIDRKTVDLRIPVTTRQKELIYAALAGEEFARWARDVLLRAAGEMAGKARGGETSRMEDRGSRPE